MEGVRLRLTAARGGCCFVWRVVDLSVLFFESSSFCCVLCVFLLFSTIVQHAARTVVYLRRTERRALLLFV